MWLQLIAVTTRRCGPGNFLRTQDSHGDAQSSPPSPSLSSIWPHVHVNADDRRQLCDVIKLISSSLPSGDRVSFEGEDFILDRSTFCGTYFSMLMYLSLATMQL